MAEQKENQFSGMTPEEIKLEAKRQIVRSAFLALAALIVIGVACYAWFVSSGTVTANVGKVSMGDITFDLASEGEVGSFDDITPDDYTVEAGEEYAPDGKTGWTWTFHKQTVKWQMTQSNNLGNFGQAFSNTALGIRPGQQGTLSFYVIPHGKGPLTITFDLMIVPLDEQGTDNWVEITDKDDVMRLLRGHLLFAYGVEGQKALVNYTDGSFTIDFGTVDENTPIRVTLDWFWPNVLSSALNSEYGNTISEWMLKEKEENAQNYFFYNPEGAVSFAAISAEDRNLNTWYNKADNRIGDEIDAIILRLNAHKES